MRRSGDAQAGSAMTLQITIKIVSQKLFLFITVHSAQ
jgi:hypothetical protein